MSQDAINCTSAAIQGDGVSIVLKKETRIFNATTGKNTISNSVSETLKALVDVALASNRDGTVKQGDHTFIIAALNLSNAPTEDDKIVFDGETLRVMSVSKMYAGASVTGYIVRTRK